MAEGGGRPRCAVDMLLLLLLWMLLLLGLLTGSEGT
jgi:hypothetical protein